LNQGASEWDLRSFFIIICRKSIHEDAFLILFLNTDGSMLVIAMNEGESALDYM